MADYEELIYRTIGNNIKKYRELARVKQEELAKEIGVSRPSVANYESGKQAIYISDLYKIAKRLSVGIGDLLPDEKELQESASVDMLVKRASDLTKKEKKVLEDFVRDAEDKGGNQ